MPKVCDIKANDGVTKTYKVRSPSRCCCSCMLLVQTHHSEIHHCCGRLLLPLLLVGMCRCCPCRQLSCCTAAAGWCVQVLAQLVQLSPSSAQGGKAQLLADGLGLSGTLATLAVRPTQPLHAPQPHIAHAACPSHCAAVHVTGRHQSSSSHPASGDR